jgi:plastocyanin
MTSSMTAAGTRTRRLALAVALAFLLAACAPWDTPGGGPGEMPHGDMPMRDMPMGDMHGSARGTDEDQAPAPVEDAAEVRVIATEMAFIPARLDLTAGEAVNVTVTNDGQLFHDFALEEAGVHLNLDPGEQATAALILDQPGSYEAICTVPGHAAAGMVLTITVEQA